MARNRPQVDEALLKATLYEGVVKGVDQYRTVTTPVDGKTAAKLFETKIDSFSFSAVNQDGALVDLVARREYRASKRYWLAYKRINGKLYTQYIGTTVTRAALDETARKLFARATPAPAPVAEPNRPLIDLLDL